MVNVYESVAANKRKSLLVVIGFIVFTTVAITLISQALSYYWGYQSSGLSMVGFALIISGISSFASYYWSDKIILGLSGARPANPNQDRLFYSVAENMSLAAGLPMPKLYIIEDTAMNAFATGRDPQHAVVCATSGLLSRMNRTELEGVVAHEMSHIINYDIRLMSIVTVLLGLVTLLADWLIRASWFGGNRKRDNEEKGQLGAIVMVAGFVFALLSPIIAQLIQLAISRRREFLADANAIKLTRQPSGLISALQKLGADREPLEAANKATAHLYISDPLKNLSGGVGVFASLFQTHPPLAERIKALEAMS